MSEPANSDAISEAPAEEALDHHLIAATLSQQGPFVLVDRVRSLVAGQCILGVKNVSLTDPYFRGHFPGNPILPGVLICEALTQAATLLVVRTPGAVPPGSAIALTGLDRVRFRRPVVPGEQLLLDVAWKEQRGSRWHLHGVARVEEEVAAEADIVLTALAEGALR